MRPPRPSAVRTAGAALRDAALGLALGAALGAVPTPADAQRTDARRADARPFAPGEHLTYEVRVARLGTVGQGSMWVEGPVDVRGMPAVLLRFHFRTRVGFVTVANETDSWLDATRMASLRFRKREHHPLSRQAQDVELYPRERRWVDGDGAGESATDLPLDELSFIYFLRTVELRPDSTYTFDRHYDPARNPTTVRVVGRDTLETAAGTFPTLVVEMRVRDRRYRDGSEGVIRIHFSDDACRIPVRLESSAPVVGRAVLTLVARRQAGDAAAASGNP